MATATPHQFTAAEYDDLPLAEVGRTELIEGLIYDVAATNDPHRYAVNRLSRILSLGLPGYLIQIDNSVAVPDWTGKTAPRPDIAIITDQFKAPAAADTFAVIEVSDTTYDWDRNTKIPIYVKAGISAYIVNIELQHVEWYNSPQSLDLPNGHVYTCRNRLSIVGVSVVVADLFPKALINALVAHAVVAGTPERRRKSNSRARDRVL